MVRPESRQLQESVEEGAPKRGGRRGLPALSRPLPSIRELKWRDHTLLYDPLARHCAPRPSARVRMNKKGKEGYSTGRERLVALAAAANVHLIASSSDSMAPSLRGSRRGVVGGQEAVVLNFAASFPPHPAPASLPFAAPVPSQAPREPHNTVRASPLLPGERWGASSRLL